MPESCACVPFGPLCDSFETVYTTSGRVLPVRPLRRVSGNSTSDFVAFWRVLAVLRKVNVVSPNQYRSRDWTEYQDESSVSQLNATSSTASDSSPSTFFTRHEFAIRRLHSLSGIVPLGAYMVVHLTTNASLLNGVPTFQRAVMQIHSLGRALPIVEWGAIFLPLLFHAIIGVWIVRTAKYNTDSYRYASNRRYVWQRWTGLIAFVFLMVHVFHLHGWFHVSYWLDYVAHPLGMANFRPYSAASTLAEAMDGVLWPAFYLIGVLACVYHLANGLWTAGITWGLWLTPQAQARATRVCTAFGLLLAVIGTGAWWAAVNVDVPSAIVDEDEMYNEAVKAKWVPDSPEKRRAAPLIEPLATLHDTGQGDVTSEGAIASNGGLDAAGDDAEKETIIKIAVSTEVVSTEKDSEPGPLVD